jgi:hypothetical protein
MELFNKLNINKLDRNELRILLQSIQLYIDNAKLDWEKDNLELFIDVISERIQDIDYKIGEWITDNKRN